MAIQLPLVPVAGCAVRLANDRLNQVSNLVICRIARRKLCFPVLLSVSIGTNS